MLTDVANPQPPPRGPVRVLITGGAGFIGSNLAARLIADGARGRGDRQPLGGPPGERPPCGALASRGHPVAGDRPAPRARRWRRPPRREELSRRLPRRPGRARETRHGRNNTGSVVGHKNYYGSRSKRGTEVAALFYSLIESAKLCGVEPKAYLLQATRAALENPGTVTLPHALLTA